MLEDAPAIQIGFFFFLNLNLNDKLAIVDQVVIISNLYLIEVSSYLLRQLSHYEYFLCTMKEGIESKQKIN